MPYKKNYKKNYKKKTYRKKTLLSSIQHQLPGFPATKACKMRYVTNLTLNAGLASILQHNFRANSIFDPDSTGVGHQPLGHDEWLEFYNHYCVVSSKITAKFVADQTPGQSGTSICGIYLADDVTIPLSPEELQEQGKGRWTYLARNGTQSPAVRTVTQTYSAKKYFNISNIKDNFDRLGAQMGSDPAEEAIFAVWTGDAVGGDPQQINVNITIEYLVIFSEPKSLAQS